MLTELVIIICTIIEIFVIIWGLAQINREIRESGEYLAQDLDSKIAGVMQNMGISGVEPINPIQAAIANMIQMRMSPGAPGNTPIQLRENNGQFQKMIKKD
ncbi:MAG: hypothetical protein GY865_15125 [candidate division Zixibacteria bacterium]|nr:hypothetical protein [candidate division Zixibacteria bacterium]|tara:strand:- start:84 stop:386 length:303 start_codon:yes stop_codon:yes gene_type:complete